jgi:hypothetical protein
MNAAQRQERPRAAARKETLPANFVHRTVDAATAPAPTGCKPSSPFLLAPQVIFADDVEQDAPRLDASFFRGGVVRFVIGGQEAFLTQREALELGSRLVAHVVAAGEAD